MTISTRLWLSAVVALVALFAFCAVLIGELQAARTARSVSSDLRETIDAANAVLSDLKDVETGGRGFLLTGLDRYLEPLVAARQLLPKDEKRLQLIAASAGDARTKDNVAKLLDWAQKKNQDTDVMIAARRRAAGRYDENIRQLDQSKRDMDAARQVAAEIDSAARIRLNLITDELERKRDLLLMITLAGAALVGLIVVVATALSLRAFSTRLIRLQRALNETGRTHGEHGLLETDEGDFAAVAASFNDMAIRLSSEAVRRDEAERNLSVLNESLAAKAQELESYSRTVNIVRRMADRLPSCADEEEFSSVVRSFAPELTPGRSGLLYLLNNSHNLLHLGSGWGEATASVREFTPEDCWGLRRGREHVSGIGQVEVTCPHIVESGKVHWCMPLVAQSETVGLLYLEGDSDDSQTQRPREDDPIYMLRETVALGLVNLRLRIKLRSQSVRDPLTGLYNRRYLDESLELELARATRSDAPVSAIMLDIDHFKTFNDTFGHDAGDLVLKEVAGILARSMRKGDIAGRFGGEEFLLLMPGADAQRALSRAETMRASIAALDVGYAGQKLGRITASFGVATFPADAETGLALVQAADKALYAAKAAGRNRVMSHTPAATG